MKENVIPFPQKVRRFFISEKAYREYLKEERYCKDNPEEPQKSWRQLILELFIRSTHV